MEEKNEKIEKSSAELKEMFQILKDDKLMELLSYVNDIVSIYYDAYTEKTGVMGYETFVKFCRDFNIFPDLCTKLILHNTFYSLAFVNSRVIEGNKQSNIILKSFIFIRNFLTFSNISI